MNRFFIIIQLIILNSFLGFSTEQSRDILIISKDTFYIDSPLESIKEPNLKKQLNSIRSKDSCLMTSCWRGFYGTWLIKQNRLYLISVKSCCDNKEYIDNLSSNRKYIYANWITDTIIFSSNNQLCDKIFYNNKTSINYYDFEIFEFDYKLIVNKGIAYVNKYDNRKTKIGKYDNEEDVNRDIDRYLNFNIITDKDLDFYMSYNIDSMGFINNVHIIGIEDSSMKSNLIQSIKGFGGLPVYYKFGEPLNDRYGGRFQINKNNTR